MNEAQYIGTVSLDFLDRSANNWMAGTTEDIIQERLINPPQNYLFTLGSGVQSTMTSLATTPAYYLPTNSQFYLAGRDVFRWGGTADPYEIDVDHYGFTPDYTKGVAIYWRAPKTEPHHLSKMPQLMNYMAPDWRVICEAVIQKRIP